MAEYLTVVVRARCDRSAAVYVGAELATRVARPVLLRNTSILISESRRR